MSEYAVLFIVAGIVETIGHQAMSILTNEIYEATLQFFPAFIFLIFAGICVVPLLLMWYVHRSSTIFQIRILLVSSYLAFIGRRMRNIRIQTVRGS